MNISWKNTRICIRNWVANMVGTRSVSNPAGLLPRQPTKIAEMWRAFLPRFLEKSTSCPTLATRTFMLYHFRIIDSFEWLLFSKKGLLEDNCPQNTNEMKSRGKGPREMHLDINVYFIQTRVCFFEKDDIPRLPQRKVTWDVSLKNAIVKSKHVFYRTQVKASKRRTKKKHGCYLQRSSWGLKSTVKISKSLLALNMGGWNCHPSLNIFQHFNNPVCSVCVRLEWLMQEYSYRLREFERSEEPGDLGSSGMQKNHLWLVSHACESTSLCMTLC